MLKVLITIDTETYPINKNWREDRLAGDMKRDIHGEIDGRAVGLGYQLKAFAEHGLKANFMVESLFSAAPEVGIEPLKEIIQAITLGGHEVQLHPHTEWIPYVPDLGVAYRSHLIRDYPLHEQEAIIRFAKDRLEVAGARSPIAFRAGGFAANDDTLTALEHCGIRYDTSFNPCFENTDRHLPSPRFYGHVTKFGEVQELPVAVFADRPSHLRPAQLCACSFAEMSHALDRAERQGWDFFVIVSHSFEMLARRWHPTKSPMIRQTVVDRFERLCEFLARNGERFETVGFSDLRLSTPEGPIAGIKGKLVNTGARLFSQAVTRLQSR